MVEHLQHEIQLTRFSEVYVKYPVIRVIPPGVDNEEDGLRKEQVRHMDYLQGKVLGSRG